MGYKVSNTLPKFLLKISPKPQNTLRRKAASLKKFPTLKK